MKVTFLVLGTTASSGPGPSHSRGSYITHNDATQSPGLLWTSDQLVAGVGMGGRGVQPNVVTATPRAEMNNFVPVITGQNFHHTRNNSESDTFRTALLSWLRNWFAVNRYKN
jgi:hypothetical protein